MDPTAFHELASGRKKGVFSTFARSGLHVASWAYRAGAQSRNRGFDRGSRPIHQAAVPVISIGNLTTGGTGKTPMVEWVCRWFRQRQRRVAILSRGYGAEKDSVNDEALQLEHLLPDVPHLQDPDRSKMSDIAVEELESEVLVLDDGFQHRRLARDLDIVLVDATNPFGYGFLLPRGLLREPKSSLRRANLIVMTRTDQVPDDRLRELREELQRLAPELPVVETIHRATCFRNHSGDRVDLTGGQVSGGECIAAFCGIGNPASFRRTLEQASFQVRDFKTFPDHHRFSREDLEGLGTWISQLEDVGRVVCTHKDLVKIGTDRIGGKRLDALCVELEVPSGLSDLEAALAKVDSIIERDESNQDEGDREAGQRERDEC